MVETTATYSHCNWEQVWSTQEAADVAVEWHGYEFHARDWALGASIPKDPRPETFGKLVKAKSPC